MSFQSINPATGELTATKGAYSDSEVDARLEAADEACRYWSNLSFDHRADYLRKAGDLLRSRGGQYGELMALEMGKPVVQGVAEAEKSAWVCDYYAENAERFLADQPIETDASESFVAYRPLGVVLAVMPWNFPFWQVFRFAAPTLMAGNAGVLKHAANVPGCALAIEQIFTDAGVPDGLFSTLLIESSRVKRVVEHPVVKAVTLTGSTAAGRAVAGVSGASLKKTVLELGGSDPYVILEDIDIEEVAEICAASRLINSGQSCIAAKRFVVVEAVREAFTTALVERMSARSVGDPLDRTTDIGPLARIDLRDELHRQVLETVEGGASLLSGGTIPSRPGAWYTPTVLGDVGPGTPGYDDEMFGPVASIIPVANEEHAIRVANDSPFGLGAAVFTRDLERGRRIAAEELEAGCCFVNAYVKSDPRLPFGGVKASGYGRELSRHGILEFVNAKTVYVA